MVRHSPTLSVSVASGSSVQMRLSVASRTVGCMVCKSDPLFNISVSRADESQTAPTKALRNEANNQRTLAVTKRACETLVRKLRKTVGRSRYLFRSRTTMSTVRKLFCLLVALRGDGTA
jgi:hypothetical protein